MNAHIRCDAEGCTERIELVRDIDQEDSCVIARAQGWTARMGSRAYHHCSKHREDSTAKTFSDAEQATGSA